MGGVRKLKAFYTVCIDSREQNPYRFGVPHRRELADGGTIVTGLEEGDYAPMLDGVLLPVRIERKSLGDLYGGVGYGRGRGEAELDRLRLFRSWLIIEASIEQVRHGFERSSIPGEAAFASVLCWSVRFSIAPIFCQSWKMGNVVCARILEEFAVHSIK